MKRYAEFLGLNGNDVARSFPLYPDTGDLEPTWQNSDVAQLRQTHLYLAYVALITVAVIGLGAVLTRLSNGDRPTSPSTVVEAPDTGSSDLSSTAGSQENSETTSSSPETASSPETTDSATSEAPQSVASSEPVPTSPVSDVPELLEGEDLSEILQPSGLTDDLLGTTLDPIASDKPVQVELELQDRSWLRVVVDGKQEFEGVLPEGSQRTWAAESTIVVRAGNAGGVLAAFNGADAEPMGNAGSVSERRFSIDDIGTAQRAAQ
ncbi:MAG: DUF4115 domain-containing protein [Okeania sp. SIO2H7]|nr:DUF4115 domain-containing protein [Okeania sp. SIO2H7]